MLALPLHGGLSSSDQRKVFRRPPRGVRKVVVSTNIAETSLTIDDIVFVIDSGMLKEMRYDPHHQMPKLVTTLVSRASADQRKGRAGRVRAGHCFRLFPRRMWGKMAPHQTPEIRRTPLERLVLQVAQQPSLGSPHQFLANAIDPPEAAAVKASVATLQELQARWPTLWSK